MVLHSLMALVAEHGRSFFDLDYIQRRKQAIFAAQVTAPVARLDELEKISSKLTDAQMKECARLTLVVNNSPVRRLVGKNSTGYAARLFIETQDPSELTKLNLRRQDCYKIKEHYNSMESLVHLSAEINRCLDTGHVGIRLIENFFNACQDFTNISSQLFTTSLYSNGVEEEEVYKKSEHLPNYTGLYIHEDEHEDFDFFVDELSKDSDEEDEEEEEDENNKDLHPSSGAAYVPTSPSYSPTKPPATQGSWLASFSDKSSSSSSEDEEESSADEGKPADGGKPEFRLVSMMGAPRKRKSSPQDAAKPAQKKHKGVRFSSSKAQARDKARKAAKDAKDAAKDEEQESPIDFKTAKAAVKALKKP